MLWSSALTPCGLHRRFGNTGLSVSCGWPTHGSLIGNIPLTRSYVQTTTSPHTLQRYSESRAVKPEHEGRVLHQNIEINVTRLHDIKTKNINPLKPELNPICYLLALLGAHHFLHVSRIRVKYLTFRRLMSYIYGAPILDVSRSHTTTQHSR